MAERGNHRGARAQAAARRLQALELRKGGATYRQIGERLNVSEAQAFRDVDHALGMLAKLTEGEAEKVRALEVARLDSVLLPMLQQAKRGSQGAVDRVLRIMERRAKLLGLDMPIRAEITGKDGESLAPKVVVYLPDNSRGDGKA